MNSDKLHFLSQPAVKSVFVYRNGDPYYEARRLVINEKRVNNFDTFLKEVTGSIQPPFGAVRNIYTPKTGHRVSSWEHIQSGEQYVAAGKEKFKKLDYTHIGTKKKRMQQCNGQLKPVPQSRIIVSARFLKPIKEPCTIFVLGNGDVINPGLRLLIPQRLLLQYERVLEMITEKMGLRILGGVRRLYTLDGTVINEGKDLENGQFYVAVGVEKFKKLPYSDLIFSKPSTMRKSGSKAASLPPIYRKQNGNSESRDHSKSSGGTGESKPSPPAHTRTKQNKEQNKDQLASIVSELSQARLLKLRQKKSGMSMSLGGQSNDDGEQEDSGESNGDQKAEPPEVSKDGTSAAENLNADNVKKRAAENIKEDAAGASAKDEGAGKPTEDSDDGPAPSFSARGNQDQQGEKKKAGERRDSPTPAPEGTGGKSEESGKKGKDDDRSGDGEAGAEVTGKHKSAEGTLKDEEETTGTYDSKKQSAGE